MDKAEQNLVDPTHKKNFDFIDSIRCISMMCIVFEHSAHVGIYLFKGLTINNLFYMSLIQLAKPGTIAFFLLAGFLIGSKFKDYTPIEYFKRRLSNTFVPWIIWSLFFVLTMSWKMWVISHKETDFNFLDLILKSFEDVYLFSSYWFIINFLICIGTLLIFRKYLYSTWLGVVLLAFTLTYSVNIYYEWFPPMHTYAMFGFIFFLWLGAQMNRYWDKIQEFINRISYSLLSFLFILTLALSIFEVTVLYKMKSTDPYNTLRFSNILYSLVAFVILLKIKEFSFTKYFKPRETTFGIYLVHYILVYNLLAEILRPFHFTPIQDLSVVGILMISLLRFIVIYSLTFAIVSAINKTKLKWIIGR